MESRPVAVILTPSGTHHKITSKTYEKIFSLGNDDFVQLDDGTVLKISMCTEILPIEEYEKQFPQKINLTTGQPYSFTPENDPYKALPTRGIDGIIELAAEKKPSLVSMANGLKRVIEKKKKNNLPTDNAEILLKKMRFIYSERYTQK